MSDSTTFTRGPWVPHLDSGSPPFVTRQNENSGWICQTVTWCGLDEAKANARLIAAAPCMFEALVDIESKIVDYEAGRINWRPDDFLLRVREALRKARGETSLAQAEAEDASE